MERAIGQTKASVAGLAADSAGNVYVAGFLSNNVFRVTPAGSITEIIDSSGDGLGNPLSLVYAVAVDASDNVYAAGVGSDNAFRITPAGTISEIIDATGDGLGHPLDEASGLATDASGNVYVSGHNSDNAFRVTPTGTIVQIIDSSGDIANPLLGAFYLAVDSGQNVYVGADVSFNLFQIPPVGLVDQVIGFDGDGLGNPLTLAYGVVVDSADNVYVAGIGSDNVFRVTAPQPATGSLVPFEARLEIDIGGFPAQVATGVGVAAITGGGVKLPEVLQLASATFPVTHPALQQVGVTIDASVRAGTLAPLDGSQSLTKRIRVGGEFRICPLVALCPTSIAVGFSLSSTDPAVALGVGGGAGTNFMGHPIFGTEAWNAAFAGWSFGPVTLTTGTASGALQTVMRTGFLHAATSSTTSVVQPNGGLQLIAPTQIVVSEPGDPVITKLALFSTLTLEFLPEPNALFGLGFGYIILAEAVQQIKTTAIIDGTVANYASEDSRRFELG